MPKGLHTQGLVILLQSAPGLDAVRACVSKFQVVREMDAAGEIWMGGPALLVGYRPDVNGHVSVDIVDRRWPDHMGDPKKETMLMGAWNMGAFGPFTFPRGLHRATQQSWRWKEAGAAVHKHTAFVRLRTSYTDGASPDAKALPPDYHAERELQFLTGLAGTLLECPGALCYFNPSGEVLLPKSVFHESAAHHARQKLPPLDLWCNVRFFKLAGGWLLMDCVGNGQLDFIDIEVGFPPSLCTPKEVDRFIRDLSLYILEKGDIIQDGDDINGPGKVRWQAKRFENGMSDPPRTTLRFLPLNQKGIPDLLTQPKARK
jgi:hypothetical protein